jgi:CheY-like chemotaxis protein
MSKNASRVLIVDNDPRVGENLKSILGHLGYSVEIAPSKGWNIIRQAIEIARDFRPHVVIVDLRLNGSYELDGLRDNDESGLRLVEELVPKTRCIVYSAYLSPEVASKIIKLKSPWVAKGNPKQLREEVDRSVKDGRAGADAFELIWPGGWSETRVVQTLFPRHPAISGDIVNDVLARIFSDHARVQLETLEGAAISPQSTTRGRSVVFKAWPGNRIQPVVIKLAPFDRIIQGESNYKNYVDGNLGGNYLAIPHREPVIFWELGAALYRCLGAHQDELHRFADFYQSEKEPEVILRPLEHFFKRVWFGLYQQRTRLQEPLFHSYDGAFGNLETRLEDYPNQERERRFPGVTVSLPNPVAWALRRKNASSIPTAQKAVTHGDLHGDNLFVDDSHAWAIDFERSGLGPVLRDFAELEVDIFTRLIDSPDGDLSLLYEMAVILAKPKNPAIPLDPTPRLQNDPACLKALTVISGLRDLMYQVTSYQDCREYLWGMLLTALFVATLAPERSSQRERALLIAAVICRRLEGWDRTWPPAD